MTWRLRLHLRRHPDHVGVGRSGSIMACGTCRGVPRPENGLPWDYMTRWERWVETIRSPRP